jgi:hypothetical protein
MAQKGKKQNRPPKSEVSLPPLTKPEFEGFLRTVTRPVQKPPPEPEKPQT